MLLQTFASEQMKLDMKHFAKILPLLFLCAACNGSLFSPAVIDEPRVVKEDSDMIVLGEKLDDPYTVENMSRALESVYGTKASRVPVEPTDYYVRFLPENEAQYELLQNIGVEMLDHPVDYRILREGDYYHDPELAEGKITWQYAVVSKDFAFPKKIRYEILDECFLAENAGGGTKADWVDWNAVERESYRLTGNEAMLDRGTKADDGDGVPSGRVTILDNTKGEYVGVKGVKVSCNCFVKFAGAFTDEDGNYRMGKSFSSDVRYRLVFKNKMGFGIGFNLILVPASVSSFGKHSPDGYDMTVDENSEKILFSRCAVNNAGYDYYKDCERTDIRKPPANLRLWLFKNLACSSAPMLQQGPVIDNSLLGEYFADYTFLVKMFLPDITMGLRDSNDYSTIYSHAIHEMAHASHFMQVGVKYWDAYIKFVVKSFVTSGFVTYGTGMEDGHGYCEIGEMWAYYVQTMFYREKFGDAAAAFGTSYWFRPQILVNLDSKGLTRGKTYDALSSDITDIDMLRKKLTSLYPELKNTINQAFERYN